jgi:DNA-directed RNA polymerase I, II, and III subunit RPABC2
MSESDVEFKSDDDDIESVGSASHSGAETETTVDESQNESVHFSDDDDDNMREEMEESPSIEEGGQVEGDQGGTDDDNDDDDDDDDDDQDFLHKFDSETKKKYIASHHPECLSFNHEETETLARVVRDENGRIVDPYHKTLPFLTKYEKTRILGIRTKQLNEGAKPYIDVNPTIIDGYIIAQLELEHKRLPFIIRRPIPNGGSELWKLQDLEIIC